MQFVPIKITVLISGRCAGFRSPATVDVSERKLTSIDIMACSRLFSLSCSEGIHTQPPLQRVVKVSWIMTSNVCEANCRTREFDVTPNDVPWASILEHNACRMLSTKIDVAVVGHGQQNFNSRYAEVQRLWEHLCYQMCKRPMQHCLCQLEGILLGRLEPREDFPKIQS